MNETIKGIGYTVSKIVTALVIGEVIGGAVSRPIAMWRQSQISASRVGELFDVMNQRICDLEEKVNKEEA